MGGQVNIAEHWYVDVDLLAPKSNFCVICVIYVSYILCHLMLFCFMLNSENKTEIKNIILIMPCIFLNDLFALKKCCFLRNANLTSIKNNSSIILLMNIMLIS